jgi:AcrR family transcriptional regulator
MSQIVAETGNAPEPVRRSQSASPRARLGVDQRRAQLLELGHELFSTHTYDELSIDDIARAAGISKGLLYHYFPSKRDYYVETVRTAAEDLVRKTETAAGAAPVERLRAGLDAYLAYVERHAKPFATLLRSGVGVDPEVSAIVEGTRRAFLERMRSEAANASPALRNALRGFIGFVEAAVLDWLDHRDVSRDELLGVLVAMAEASVATVSQPAPQR